MAGVVETVAGGGEVAVRDEEVEAADHAANCCLAVCMVHLPVSVPDGSDLSRP